MGHALRCPDCGNNLAELDIQVDTNIDGSTHYCSGCNEYWLIVWQRKGD